MSWVRVMVANYLAAGGKQWSDTFSRQNGGTYNNQWSAAPTARCCKPDRCSRAELSASPTAASSRILGSLPERFELQLN